MKNIQIILLALLIFCNLSCRKTEEPVYKPVPGEEIRIGVLIALTGTGSSSGKGSQASLELARQDIMDYFATIQMKQKVTLIMADTKTDTAEAINQMRGFYHQGIRLVIGPYSSAEVLAIKNFADTHGMLIVSPSSVSVSLAIPGDNVFRFVTCDVIQGEAMNKMLVEDKIKVIVPIIRDDLWGKDLLSATQKNFVKSGGQVLEPVKINPVSTDFSAELNNLDIKVGAELVHHNPNEVAVYMLTYAEGNKILATSKQYSNLNSVYWYGGSAFAQNAYTMTDTNAALFAYTHGLPCPIFGLDEAAKDKWQPLIERIQAQTGYVPDVYAITAYDALWVSVRTYLVTGLSPDIELLKTVFTNESDKYFGASGSTSLDVNGDRAHGNYDFWAIKRSTESFSWERVAKYNSVTGQLTRITK